MRNADGSLRAVQSQLITNYNCSSYCNLQSEDVARKASQAKTEYSFQYETVRNWLDEYDETDWYVPGIIPMNSLTMLVAAPKGGKTFYLLNLARAALEGGFFMEHRVRRHRARLVLL